MRCDTNCTPGSTHTPWTPDPAASYLVIEQGTGKMTTTSGRHLSDQIGATDPSRVFELGKLRHGPRYVIDAPNGLLIVEQHAPGRTAVHHA